MDITNAIMDQELGRSAFTVERLTYTRTAEGTTSRSATHQAMGCVHPGTPEMIQLLPEEERHETFIAIYTDFALSLGSDHGSTYTGPDRTPARSPPGTPSRTASPSGRTVTTTSPTRTGRRIRPSRSRSDWSWREVLKVL